MLIIGDGVEGCLQNLRVQARRNCCSITRDFDKSRKISLLSFGRPFGHIIYSKKVRYVFKNKKKPVLLLDFGLLVT